jgi:hypothetical protein
MTKITAAIFALMVMVCCVIPVSGCGNQKVSSALDAVQAASESAKTTFHVLATAAESMIPLLPADQQAAKRELLTQIVIKGDLIFQAEEDAILAAIQANAQTLDVSAFTAAIATVLEDLLSLSQVLNVRSDVVANAQARVTLLKAQR